MIRIAAGAAVAGLLAVAGYIVYAVVFVIASGEFPNTRLFWTSVSILVVLACTAAWLATRIYRRVFRQTLL